MGIHRFHLFLTISLACSCLLFSCAGKEQKEAGDVSIFQAGHEMIMKDSLINLKYGPRDITWNDFDNCFIENEDYKAFMDKKIDDRTLINVAESISDTTDLVRDICSKKRNLRKGDLAFILLYDSNYIAPAHDLGMQFDAFDNDCRFPCGLLDFLEDNRELVKNIIIKKLQAK